MWTGSFVMSHESWPFWGWLPPSRCTPQGWPWQGEICLGTPCLREEEDTVYQVPVSIPFKWKASIACSRLTFGCFLKNSSRWCTLIHCRCCHQTLKESTFQDITSWGRSVVNPTICCKISHSKDRRRQSLRGAIGNSPFSPSASRGVLIDDKNT